MNCLKCGQEILSGQVFCEDCLEIMRQQPVNPDAPVHLPRQREPVPVKKPVKKRAVSAEEQIQILRGRLRFLLIWCLASTILAIALAYPAVLYLKEDHFKLGQNYSSFSVTEPSETESETAPLNATP